MKIPLRNKMLLLFYRLFNKEKYPKPLLKISNSGKGVRNIIFLLPSNKIQAQTVSYFAKRNTNQKVRFIIHEKGLPYYKDIPHENFIIYRDSDINWFGAIRRKSITRELGDKSYDCLIDLCQSYELALSLLTIHFNIPIKIGIQSPIAKYLFSIVIEPSKDGFLETNYLLIENILGISKK